MDRPRRVAPRMRGLFDGPDRAPPGLAAAERGPGADQRPAAVDRRHLRVHGRGLADHDGNARRPDRPAPAAPDRRRSIRRRIHPGRVLHERRNADRVARAARDRRRDRRALDPVADPQHVPRLGSAHVRDRDVDHRLFTRRRTRAAPWRCAARVLLVGLGLPAGRAGHGPVAGAGTGGAPGVPRSRGRTAGPAERGAVAGCHAGRDLRAEAARPGRRRMAPGPVDPRGPGPRLHLRPPPAKAHRPSHRPTAFPRTGLQRVARASTRSASSSCSRRSSSSSSTCSSSSG